MEFRKPEPWVYVICVIFVVAIYQLIGGSCEYRAKSKIEDALYLWTHGEVYCAECKVKHKVMAINVGDPITHNSRKANLLMKEHYEESRSMEAALELDGDSLRVVKIGRWPGRAFDCND